MTPAGYAGDCGTVVGCYLLKLVGYLVPARVLDHGRDAARGRAAAGRAARRARRRRGGRERDGTTTSTGRGWPASRVGAVAVWRRAPFLVVVVAAALTAALLRLG